MANTKDALTLSVVRELAGAFAGIHVEEAIAC